MFPGELLPSRPAPRAAPGSASRSSGKASAAAPGTVGGVKFSLLTANRETIFYALAITGTLFLLPFSVNNFLQGRHLFGVATSAVVAGFVINVLAIYRGKPPPVEKQTLA